MSELFDTSAFSSKNEIRGSTDSAWDDGSAFPELSSLRDAPSRSLEWVVGDRCQIITPKKYSGEKGYVCGFHADDSPEIWVKLDNHDLQIRVNPDEARFLEEKQSLFKVGDRTLNNALIQEIRGEAFRALWDNGYSNWYAIADLEDGYAKMPIAIDITDLYKQEEGAMSTTTPKENAECNNSHNLTSAQELEPVFALQDSAPDSNLSESQKLMNTAQASSQNGSPMSATTVMCEVSQCEISENSGEKSTLLQLRHHASPFQSRESDKEKTTPATVSPPSNEQLNQSDPNSSVLKMCQDSSPVAETPAVKHSIFSTSFVRLPSSATMQNGFVSAQDTLPAPTLENGYCWLESPGALSSTGKGRPPGQSRQEAQLRQHGLLAKGEVLRPDFLLNGYNLPPSYLDPSDCRPATQLLEECDRQQEIFSIPELPALPLIESSTSTHYAENHLPVTRANAQPETYIINQSESLGKVIDNLGFGFVVEWLSSCNQITYNWERDDRLIGELAIAPQSLVEKFLEDNQPQLCTKCFQVVAKSYTCEKCPYIECTQQLNHVSCPSCESPLLTLNNGCGVCEWIPENFLEETEPATTSTEKPKHRQRKGCLYKYLENKKLKNGTIASYPRVIGHRHPDNPTHWRWGFNWEEKVDGEWKGRSIGSVPLGAIALIQSMQNLTFPVKSQKACSQRILDKALHIRYSS
jgi:rubrerythrin